MYFTSTQNISALNMKSLYLYMCIRKTVVGSMLYTWMCLNIISCQTNSLCTTIDSNNYDWLTWFLVVTGHVQDCHFSGIVPEITSISIWLLAYRHWWQYCRQLHKNTNRLPILKCMSITVTQDKHYLSFHCVILTWGSPPGRRLATFYWLQSSGL